MYDLIRDSTIGQVIHLLSAGRYLSYPEERPGYTIPDLYRYADQPSEPSLQGGRRMTKNLLEDGQGRERTDIEMPECQTSRSSISGRTLVDPSAIIKSSTSGSDVEKVEEKVKSGPEYEDGYLIIDWDGDDDPENPYNFSPRKKLFITLSICILTFAVYAGSSMYTASIPGLMEDFGCGLVKAELGLTLFVFGYATGPMFLSPLQEIPSLGRNPVYMISLFAYLMFTIGAAVAKNVETVLVMRFWAGFFGSPALATGGATIGDIYPERMLPYMIGAWSIGAVCGPSFAPLIGGYTAMALGWRWPLWILVFMSAFSLVFLLAFLPETLGSTILHKRALRLRKLTGNDRISTKGEREQAKMTFGELAYDALGRPIRLMLEPQVLYLSVYLGLVYALFYLFFESFPIVFQDGYGFNEGELGLAFMGITVAAPISYAFYALYNKYHLEPLKDLPGGDEPELVLNFGIIGGCLIPISQLWYGWSARPEVHWIVPIIGSGLYLPGVFLMFQSILVYLPSSYPMYAASVLAANDLIRSSMASVFPLFGRPYFVRLGLGGGSSLLAGLSILMIPGIVWIRFRGKKLRAMSRIIPRDQNPAIDKKSAIEA